MTAPYYADETVTLHHGDALDVLRTLPAGSVDCCVTSPPYFGLRDYGVAGQIGAEASPAEFVARLVGVFREVRRVLADDGTCWVNLSDSYAGSWGAQGKDAVRNGGLHSDVLAASGYATKKRRTGAIPVGGLPAKNLLGVPWRFAFAMQDDGWTLRNAIIWAKPNAMPESVTDRLSGRYEHVFLFAKSRRYWFDLDPIREKAVTARQSALTWDRDEQGVPGQKPQHRPGRKAEPLVGGHGTMGHDGNGKRYVEKYSTGLGRNPGDVWTIPTSPFPGAHFATFPPELPRRCILAGCRPGGTVLDPFHGSGTTGMVAQHLGRRYVGIDLSAEYLDLSLRTRLADAAMPFEEGEPA